MGARNELTRVTTRSRPGWFWPLIVGFALVPIMVAVVLYLSATTGEKAGNTPAPPSLATASDAASEPVVASATIADVGRHEDDVTTPMPVEDVVVAVGDDVPETVPEVVDEDTAIATVDVPTVMTGEVVAKVGNVETSRPSEPVAPVAPGARGFGEVSVRSRPWALISVDGKAMGMTPKVLKLTPGRHSLTFTRGGSRHTQSVTVLKDRAIVVQHDLD